MPIIKQHDFVEIEYTGKLKEDGAIFDTTIEKVAKEHGLFDKSSDYSPLVICVGESHILKSLEDQMIGKETGKEYVFSISSEDAFGKKDPKLIQLMPTGKFRQQNIQPVPGLQLNIDGVFGVVKTVSGGRCLVDFNHPLSGKDLLYDVKINKLVDEDKDKLKALLQMKLQVKDAQIELKEGSASIKLSQNVPKESQEEFRKVAGRLLPNVKNVDFTIEQELK